MGLTVASYRCAVMGDYPGFVSSGPLRHCSGISPSISSLTTAVHKGWPGRYLDSNACVQVVSTQPVCIALKLKYKNLFIELVCLVDIQDV